MSKTNGENREIVAERITASGYSFLFLILGFILVAVGAAVILIATVLYSGGSASAGAIILIGPFPIVIGAGPDATWIVLFSVILSVLGFVVFLVMSRKSKKSWW